MEENEEEEPGWIEDMYLKILNAKRTRKTKIKKIETIIPNHLMTDIKQYELTRN